MFKESEFYSEGQVKVSELSRAYGFSIEMKNTKDVYSFGVEYDTIDARLVMEETSVVMEDWDDTKGAILLYLMP